VRQVPTAAEKAGLFTTAVVDPAAPGRPEFARNAQGQWVIPSNRWDPVGAAIVRLIPDPNVPDSTIYASTPVFAKDGDTVDRALIRRTRLTMDVDLAGTGFELRIHVRQDLAIESADGLAYFLWIEHAARSS
jgi:hypothetical protein